MRIDDTGSTKAAVAEAFSFRNRIFSVLSNALVRFFPNFAGKFYFFLVMQHNIEYNILQIYPDMSR